MIWGKGRKLWNLHTLRYHKNQDTIKAQKKVIYKNRIKLNIGDT